MAREPLARIPIRHSARTAIRSNMTPTIPMLQIGAVRVPRVWTRSADLASIGRRTAKVGAASPQQRQQPRSTVGRRFRKHRA
jgi:hypothetical protein